MINKDCLFKYIGGGASLGFALTLAGCIGATNTAGIKPAPLQPVPVSPVTSQNLAPISQPTVGAATTSTGEPQDLQAIPTSVGNRSTGVGATDLRISPDAPFGKNDMLGAWNAEAETDACALTFSLTQWTGGLRASVRRCTNDKLKSIGAWQLAGKQLLLKDQTGAVTARLYASGTNRFDGQFQGTSTPISVYR